MTEIKRRIKKNPRFAFAAGERAKRNGWDRLSPFSDDPAADFFFLSGFDGQEFVASAMRWNILCNVELCKPSALEMLTK